MEDNIWLPGGHLLAIAKSGIRFIRHGHGNGSISSTHHVRQPVRTLGNFALVRLGRACEVFSDCLEAMAVQSRRHDSVDHLLGGVEEIVYVERPYKLLLRHGALSLGGGLSSGKTGHLRDLSFLPCLSILS